MLHQGKGVRLGALRRAEAGHGERLDLAALRLERIKGFARDQEREGRIEAARDTDRNLRLAKVLQAFGKPGNLRVKYFRTAFGELFLAARHERMRVDRTDEPPRRLQGIKTEAKFTGRELSSFKK